MITIVVAFGFFITWLRYRRHLHSRHLAAQLASLPDVTDLILAAMQAGCTPVHALYFLARSAPMNVRGAFAEAATAIEDGERFASVIGQLPQRLGNGYRPLCDILSAGDRLGIPIEILMTQVSSDSHLTRRLLAEADARRLPVRLSWPLVCCTLPSFVVLVMVPVIAGTLSQLHITS